MFLKTMIVFGALHLTIHLAMASNAVAQSLQQAPMIFDARKSLPLEPDEPAYHDFYINAGTETGFKKGAYVTVVRVVPVHDPVQNKQQALLNIGIARLKVIHVERNITVARLQEEFTDEDRPTVEFEAVMVGDRVDLASMTMEAPKSKKSAKKTAAAEPETREVPRTEVAQQPPVPVTSEPIAMVPAPLADVAVKAVPAEETGVKNASPPANPPDMVRIPVPSAAKTL